MQLQVERTVVHYNLCMPNIHQLTAKFNCTNIKFYIYLLSLLREVRGGKFFWKMNLTQTSPNERWLQSEPSRACEGWF